MNAASTGSRQAPRAEPAVNAASEPVIISAERAEEYASWFRCLSDGTRVRILNYLAAVDEPVTVGRIVDAVGKSQSTVSRHLQILADDRFVFTEPDGVRTLITANRACMTALPEAAAAIMAASSRATRS